MKLTGFRNTADRAGFSRAAASAAVVGLALAGLVCGGSAFALDTVDARDGRTWAKPGQFLGLSWNQVDQICPEAASRRCGGALEGFTWASNADARVLLESYLQGVDPNADTLAQGGTGVLQWFEQASLASDNPFARHTPLVQAFRALEADFGLTGLAVLIPPFSGEEEHTGAFRYEIIGWTADSFLIDPNNPASRVGGAAIVQAEHWKTGELCETNPDADDCTQFDNPSSVRIEVRNFGTGAASSFPNWGGWFYLTEDSAGEVRVSNLAAAPNPVAVQGVIDLTATGVSSQDVVTSARWSLVGADGAMHPEDGQFDAAEERLYAQVIAPYEAGIYPLCVQARDTGGNVSNDECITLVVFDPASGFVTGGGWFWSPPGAMPADALATGRANFGFVARYAKGRSTPDGAAQFVFQAGGLNFHSEDLEWLVVNGASQAMFKGNGRVNGAHSPAGAPYQFMVSAGDGQPDTLRIKIWYEDAEEVVVYDNGSSNPIAGGQIVIHTGRGGK